MAVEILSPSKFRYDLITKLNRYPQAGVLEYWIVDPEDKIIQVHLFIGGS